MDARDLPPLQSSSPENDALLPIRSGLARDAALLFQSRHYAECVEVLKQLLPNKKQDDRKEDDPKVLHNIAVAEYFRDGCSDPRKLLSELDNVKKKSEELVCTSGELIEVAGSPGSNIITETRGSSTPLFQLSTANTGDTSVVTFNIAVILYHLHEFRRASSVLLPLFQNIHPIIEPIALHISFLLLDIALASQDASTAANVIQFLEKKCFGIGFAMNSDDNGSGCQLQSMNLGLKISAATSNIVVQDNSSSDSSASANVSENPLVRTPSDDGLEFENLYSTIDGGVQNLVGRPASDDLLKPSGDWVAPAFDLNLKIHLYKVRFLILTKNHKATKREVKLAMNYVRGRDSSTELILKSQVEYCRCNHNKAIKLFQACSNRTEPAMQIIFDNNLGCIYHQLGKYNSSYYLFTKALKASSSQLSEKPRKLPTFSQNKFHYIVYNCGLQALVCGRPSFAACALHEAAPIFDNRPLFWLRSAECCLLALRKGLPISSGGASKREEIKVYVAGSGSRRQLIVDDGHLKNGYPASTVQDDALGACDKIKLSLPFARQCLLKALILLDSFEKRMSNFGTDASVLGGDSKASSVASSIPANANEGPKEIKDGQSPNSSLQNSVSAYMAMCRKENRIINQVVLGDLAYVELCLEEPSRALNAARLLQKLPDCSRMYSFLSHVYAAEALCHLNRLEEAMEELMVYIRDENNINLPYSDEDVATWSTTRGGDGEESKSSAAARTVADGSLDWASLNPEVARGALYTNLAAMFMMMGELKQAGRYAKEALACLPDNPRATLAAVCVDLKQGRTHDALIKLRQSRHVRFLSTGVSSSKVMKFSN